MEKDWPFITIAMPVRNEEAFIEDTLNQLLQQDYPADRFEIIVADGKSTDRTREIVQKIAERYPQIKLMDNVGRLPSSGRNIGFKNGRGEYFLVIDGHCYIPNRQLLKNVAKLFVNTEADCLGRPQPFIIPNKPTWQRAIALARSSSLGHSTKSYIHSNKEGYVSPVSVGCAYSKNVFKKIGYVDESFDACEDVEFNYRVEKAGFKTYFSPKIAVYYYPRKNIRGLWRQLVRYGEGRAKFIIKYPETINLDMFLPIFFTVGMSFGIFTGFLFKFLFIFYFLILIFYFLTIMFASIKIRTYEPLGFILKLIIVFFIIHFSLGYGLIKGFTKKFIAYFKNFKLL
ncbi:MAG: glycosyltransferase family 2 protein [Candidatus Helarchaeota archaeon]